MEVQGITFNTELNQEMVTVLGDDVYVCERGSKVIDVYGITSYESVTRKLIYKHKRRLELPVSVKLYFLEAKNDTSLEVIALPIERCSDVFTVYSVDPYDGSITLVPDTGSRPMRFFVSNLAAKMGERFSHRSFGSYGDVLVSRLHGPPTPFDPERIRRYFTVDHPREAKITEGKGYSLWMNQGRNLLMYDSTYEDNIQNLGYLPVPKDKKVGWKLDAEKGLFFVWTLGGCHFSVFSIMHV